MIFKTLFASILLTATVSQAVAYTGGPVFRMPPERCIVGERCFDTCFVDRAGNEQCQELCYLELGPCGPDEGGGLDDCDDVGDGDDAPDECDDENLAP